MTGFKKGASGGSKAALALVVFSPVSNTAHKGGNFIDSLLYREI
jgi:hypothetical protein